MTFKALLYNIYLFIYIKVCNSSYSDELKYIIYTCQSHRTPFLIDLKTTKIVDVVKDVTIQLQCKYCNASEDQEDESWLFIKKRSIFLDDPPKLLSIRANALVIHNLDTNHSGNYTCGYLSNRRNIFRYVLNNKFARNKIPCWELIMKTQKNISLKNSIFEIVDGIYISLLGIYNENLLKRNSFCKTTTYGEEICNKNGLLESIPHKIQKRNVAVENIDKNITSPYMINKHDVSCRPSTLRESMPLCSELFNDFDMTEVCYISGGDSNFIINKSHKIKKVLAEKSHLTLICPDITLDSKVQWYKNGNCINSSFRHNMAEKETEPHLTIDVYNSLYILQATKEEEGIYSCRVNGQKIQDYDVKVVSKSTLLNQEFIRYSIYLGFVFLLTITCYCAGICVAWHRKASFVDPLNMS